MTALLTLEREKLADVVPAAGYDALPVESQIDLAPGERMTVADLLRALLLESANDAAVTLAEAVSGSRPAFVRAMNRRARQLGLEDTRYANPIGLDDAGNYSSARDLARLTLELRRNEFFRSDRQPRLGDACAPARGRARSPTATTSSRASRGSTGSRPDTRCRPATCSSARAAAGRAPR